MRPKGKLLVLIALFAAVGLITATGAFTTVEAERTATVDVAGDSAALLAMAPADGDTNAGVVQEDNGQLTIDLQNPGNQGAEGINPNALTAFSPAINVTNQGTNNVELDVGISVDQGSLTDANVAMNISDGSPTGTPGDDITTGTVTLTPGDTVTVDFVLDLRAGTGNQVDNPEDNIEITITFNANESS